MKIIIIAIISIVGFTYANIIDTVLFVGNVKTKDKFLQKIVSPIIKKKYDVCTDSLIYDALKKTGLFGYISVVSSKKIDNDNVSIFVVVKENNYLSVGNAGLGINSMEYGEKSDSWLWFNLDVNYKNFLGIGHSLNFTGRVWRDRYFGANWHIPIGITPYFFEVGGLIGRNPSLVFAWETAPYFNTDFRFGRYIGNNQEIYIETSPKYSKYNNMLKVDDKWKIHSTDEFLEIYEKLYYSLDYKDKNYPPLLATFFSVGLSTNKIMAYIEDGKKKDFWNIDTDFKQNIPIFQKIRHSLYIRSRISITPWGEHNKYDGFLSGGQYYIRGWKDDILGSKDNYVFNNSILGTAEYQFNIFTFPSIKFRWLSWYDDLLSNFSPILAGALFFDAGYLFKEISSPLQCANTNAGSVGISLRLLQPLMKIGGTLEFAWQVIGDKKYYNENRRIPVIHIGFVSQF
ncbi:MAG: BamA/TamA family outer membrane protein [Chitinispirillales bacterium]|jgi:outer membrane protein assembly factor BamA|nr:BamA/TamA family outer membrane protein [Chitinispirillales bacterium]